MFRIYLKSDLSVNVELEQASTDKNLLTLTTGASTISLNEWNNI